MKCPHCKKPPYPIKDENGKWIVKNLFKTDPVHLGFFIALIFLLLGFQQIQGQCNALLESPCKYADQAGCMCSKLDINDRSNQYDGGFFNEEEQYFNLSFPS